VNKFETILAKINTSPARQVTPTKGDKIDSNTTTVRNFSFFLSKSNKNLFSEKKKNYLLKNQYQK
jgi:hypothetical protein